MKEAKATIKELEGHSEVWLESVRLLPQDDRVLIELHYVGESGERWCVDLIGESE